MRPPVGPIAALRSVWSRDPEGVVVYVVAVIGWYSTIPVLGAMRVARIVLSWLRRAVFPLHDETNLEQLRTAWIQDRKSVV